LESSDGWVTFDVYNFTTQLARCVWENGIHFNKCFLNVTFCQLDRLKKYFDYKTISANVIMIRGKEKHWVYFVSLVMERSAFRYTNLEKVIKNWEAITARHSTPDDVDVEAARLCHTELQTRPTSGLTCRSVTARSRITW